MRRGLNKVMIIGRLGRDPELRYTPSGQAVATFPVVTTRYWNTAAGERRSETERFNVVAWGSLAEICKQFLTKGEQVYIEGRLKTRRWEDANGQRRYSVEIVASEMIILGERRRFTDRDHHERPFGDDGGFTMGSSASTEGIGSEPAEPSEPDESDLESEI
ncbi:MAG: single-stranded DNA-binding protein [Chloroflexi bacterium]|nr:single-stranded DNA-binding protein [Chloroflexota bacterium]